jgi:hypothetical protein
MKLKKITSFLLYTLLIGLYSSTSFTAENPDILRHLIVADVNIQESELHKTQYTEFVKSLIRQQLELQTESYTLADLLAEQKSTLEKATLTQSDGKKATAPLAGFFVHRAKKKALFQDFYKEFDTFLPEHDGIGTFFKILHKHVHKSVYRKKNEARKTDPQGLETLFWAEIHAEFTTKYALTDGIDRDHHSALNTARMSFLRTNNLTPEKYQAQLKRFKNSQPEYIQYIATNEMETKFLGTAPTEIPFSYFSDFENKSTSVLKEYKSQHELEAVERETSELKASINLSRIQNHLDSLKRKIALLQVSLRTSLEFGKSTYEDQKDTQKPHKYLDKNWDHVRNSLLLTAIHVKLCEQYVMGLTYYVSFSYDFSRYLDFLQLKAIEESSLKDEQAKKIAAKEHSLSMQKEPSKETVDPTERRKRQQAALEKREEQSRRDRAAAVSAAQARAERAMEKKADTKHGHVQKDPSKKGKGNPKQKTDSTHEDELLERAIQKAAAERQRAVRQELAKRYENCTLYIAATLRETNPTMQAEAMPAEVENFIEIHAHSLSEKHVGKKVRIKWPEGNIHSGTWGIKTDGRFGLTGMGSIHFPNEEEHSGTWGQNQDGWWILTGEGIVRYSTGEIQSGTWGFTSSRQWNLIGVGASHFPQEGSTNHGTWGEKPNGERSLVGDGSIHYTDGQIEQGRWGFSPDNQWVLTGNGCIQFSNGEIEAGTWGVLPDGSWGLTGMGSLQFPDGQINRGTWGLTQNDQGYFTGEGSACYPDGVVARGFWEMQPDGISKLTGEGSIHDHGVVTIGRWGYNAAGDWTVLTPVAIESPPAPSDLVTE